MAHLETWYRCPICNRAHDTYSEAVKCRNKHPIQSERWAVGKRGKVVRIFNNFSAKEVDQSLREADLSDLIEERKRQLTAAETRNV